MSILTMRDDGSWSLEYDLTPVEFWPYTTIVTDVVMTAPRDKFKELNKELITMFRESGIRAYEENKCAFGLLDHKRKKWYLGFKDFRFDLGMSVRPDLGLKPAIAIPTPECPKCKSTKDVDMGTMSWKCDPCGTSFT